LKIQIRKFSNESQNLNESLSDTNSATRLTHICVHTLQRKGSEGGQPQEELTLTDLHQVAYQNTLNKI